MCESRESCVCIVGFSACGCQKKSVVYETECRHVAVQRDKQDQNIYTTETHTSDFILNTFWNGKLMQFFQEGCWVVATGCQENESCSKVSNFLERLDYRIRCIHEETVAAVKPWEDIGSNKSLGCVFREKPADRTNAFKLEISSLADFYDVLLHGRFWVKNESKVPGRIREGDVVSGGVKEGNCRRFQGRRRGKEKSFCFCRHSVWADFRSSMFLCRLCITELFGEVGHFTERNGFLELYVICEKLFNKLITTCFKPSPIILSSYP